MANRLPVSYYTVLIFLLISMPLTVSQQRGPGVSGGIVFSGNYDLPAGNTACAKKLPPGKSTTLHLTSENPLALESNYSISFIASIRNGSNQGNILGIVNRAYKLNIRIDSPSAGDSVNIELIFKGKPAGLRFALTGGEVHEGNPLRFKLDVVEESGNITFSLNGKSLQKKFPPFPSGEASDIFFGSPPGKTDCAPMTLQDLRIKISGQQEHRYLFNETGGNIAFDSEGSLNAAAINHTWLINRHFYWAVHDSITYKKDSFRTFFCDPYNNELGILTKDGMEHYSFRDGSRTKVKFRETEPPRNYLSNYPNQDLVMGYSSAFPDDEAATFDFKNGIQEGNITKVTDEGHYYGGRLLVNTGSGSVNILSGYGWYKAKNKLLRFNPATRQWNELQIKGDFFPPRHSFAVLPSQEKDVYYLMGGVGNKSGNQGDGFYYLWDLYRFNLDSLTIKKVFDWGRKESYQINYEAVWVNETKSEIYTSLRPYGYVEGLSRQMGRLNFKDTVLTLVGDTSMVAGFRPATGKLIIDYLTEQLFSITTTGNDSSVTVLILSIKTPLLPESEYHELTASAPNNLEMNRLSNWTKWGMSLAALLLLPLVSIYYRKYRRRKKRSAMEITEKPGIDALQVEKHTDGEFITLFGGLKIVDSSGSDLTRNLTPKQNEIVSCIAYHSFKDAKSQGIALNRLDNAIWQNTPAENLKNTRNATFSKIRSSLKDIEGFSLTVQDNSVSLSLDDKYFNEIKSYFALKNYFSAPDRLKDEEPVNNFIRIVGRGKFMGSLSGEWVEEIRSKEESDIIRILSLYLKSIFADGNFERCVKVIDAVSVHDPLNEELLGLKLRSLYNLGRHSIALEIYESYCKEYELIFDEKYQVKFQDLLKG